ncbi:MAG: hypothetical protein JJU41_03675 [Bacteroidetes bacterium]|nr:hypothetical protein [Bacteroidota bacterium]MCH8524603.1 hypothetical protein [Balneolales bacterium]
MYTTAVNTTLACMKSMVALMLVSMLLTSCNVTGANDDKSMQYGLQLRVDLSERSVRPFETMHVTVQLRNYRIEDVHLVTASPSIADIVVFKDESPRGSVLNVPGSHSGGPGISGHISLPKNDAITLNASLTMVQRRYNFETSQIQTLPLEPGNYIVLIHPNVIFINGIEQRLDPIEAKFVVR